MLRQLTLDDMPDAASVMRASYDAALPALAGRHTPDEDIWFFQERLFPTMRIWGAFRASQLAGVIAWREGWVEQLYVHPRAQHQGFGAGLLAIAKEHSTTLELWTFQCNAPARRFYEARGFVPVTMTDGSRNEERTPDVLYRWTPLRARN
jgi:GNAT superfamily N-acetyltransferase